MAVAQFTSWATRIREGSPTTVARAVFNPRVGPRQERLPALSDLAVRSGERSGRSPAAWNDTPALAESLNRAFSRLFLRGSIKWCDRASFLAGAARAVRLLRSEAARREMEAVRSQSESGPGPGEASTAARDILQLDGAIDILSRTRPLQARILELRHHGAMNPSEMADALSVPLRRIEEEAMLAEAWLDLYLRRFNRS